MGGIRLTEIFIDKNRNLCSFVFFYNTPLVNFDETIHFKSNSERDSYFLDKAKYKKLKFDTPFNFYRDKGEIKIPAEIGDYEKLQGINYCTFKDSRNGKRYYAFVVKIEYINAKVIKMHLLIDVLMTFTQGKVLNTIKNVEIIRQHLEKNTYKKYIKYLKKNDDILKTYTKGYFFENRLIFNKFYVLIQSSADLESDFGDEDRPLMKSAKGGKYDKIVSPLSLYIVKYEDFQNFTERLSKYPWIAQNLKKIILIPQDLIDSSDLEQVNNGFGFSGLYRLKNNRVSKVSKNLENELKRISMSYNDLMKLCNLKENEEHLLRSQYVSCEMNNYTGESIPIDLSDLNTNTGLQISCNKIVGYENEIAFYVKDLATNNVNYDFTGTLDISPEKRGHYLKSALFFKDFDTIPVLIDNYTLNIAQNANQRNLAESKLISSRIGNIFNPNSSLQSRFYDTVSTLSNLNPLNLLGRFTDEYEYYRDLKASQEDMKLTPPTETSASNGNSFSINNDIFGMTLKFSKPTDEEMDIIKTYYKTYGFSLPLSNVGINNIESQNNLNYLQIKGNYILPDVDPTLMELLREILEKGVKFYHYDNTDNFYPNKYSIFNNRWK